MKVTTKSQRSFREIQQLIDDASSALREHGSTKLGARLKRCGCATHREVFLGKKYADDGALKSSRVGTGLCDGSNFCPRCHSIAAGDRVKRTIALCRAHLGDGTVPTINQKMAKDLGWEGEDVVPVIMLFTLTVPRKGGQGKESWERDVKAFEDTRRKFFNGSNPKVYWSRFKRDFNIVSFVRSTDVTYQLFGDMRGPHWHAHGLFFGVMYREEWERICSDENEKMQFEDRLSQSLYTEWQRAASRVDYRLAILKPYRTKGNLKGGVTVELARDLGAASEYISKNMAMEVAYGAGKIASKEGKYTWGELIDIFSSKGVNDTHIVEEEARNSAKELYTFHAEQGARDQFTVGNIIGKVSMEAYYFGKQEERDAADAEERAVEEAKVEYTHNSPLDTYNFAKRVDVETSVDKYEAGEDVEKVCTLWNREKRTQEQIRERIKDNAAFGLEKAAFNRWVKGCRTEKTLRSALAWCIRNEDWKNKRIAEKLIEKMYPEIDPEDVAPN